MVDAAGAQQALQCKLFTCNQLRIYKSLSINVHSGL